MSIYKRGRIWWLYVVAPHKGPRIRRSTGERERARAQRIHDEIKAELWQEQRGGTLHGALDAWVKGKGASDRYQVAKLKKLADDQPLAALDLEALAAAIPQKTAGTFNRYVNALSAAGVKGIARRKVGKGRIRWLTAEEWEALREALPDHQRPMAELAIATGLRQANVFRLEWGQVDFKRRRAWIHADQTKAGEPIGIALSPEALRVLKAQHKVTGKGKWVFVGKDGKNPPTEIKTGWKRALKDAKIQNFTWHGLRHTWASWHAMNGTKLEALQKLGGWADIRMVMRYAHLAESYVDEFAGNAKPYSLGHNPRHTKKLNA